MVRIALVDEDATVRGAAAKAFDVLQEYVGPKAIDQTIPTLLDALRQPGASSGTALKALKEVMNVSASIPFSLSSSLSYYPGPRFYRVPCPHPYPHCITDDCVQCTCARYSCYSGRQCT